MGENTSVSLYPDFGRYEFWDVIEEGRFMLKGEGIIYTIPEVTRKGSKYIAFEVTGFRNACVVDTWSLQGEMF